MWSSRVLPAIFALFTVGASASDVLDLHKDDFTSTVAEHDLMLVEFFAPWCGHCKALAPHYEEAAASLKEKSIALAKVDCTAESELCKEQGISGYPTLKVFRRGEASPYGGPRKTEGIISYMHKQALPPVSEIDATNLDSFSTSDNIVIVGFFGSAETAAQKTFDEFAQGQRDNYVFGRTSDPEALSSAGVTSTPAVVLYKKFDEGRADLAGSVTTSALESFVKENSIPLLDEISPENFITYAEAGIPIGYVFVESEDSGKEDLIKSLQPVAREFKGKVNFVWIDASKFGDHGKSLNLEGTWPAFAIQNVAEGTKYPLDSKLTINANTIRDFVSRFTAGKVAPSIKSERIPETQNESSYHLVANEFDKIVFDDSKDVFLEVYAPWCGFCKRLAPTWEQLAGMYADSANKITIAKLDATANDLPPSAGFRVAGFPTLKFKPAGSREFLAYEGDRSLEDMMEFIGNHTANKVVAKETPPAAAPEGEDHQQEVFDDQTHDEL